MPRRGLQPLGSASLFEQGSAATKQTTDVLFVCTGNICRSALAEKLLAHRRPDLSVASAGTGALVGWGMDEFPAEYAKQHGADAAHTARQLDRRIEEDARLILTMTREHRTRILREHPRMQQRTFTLVEFVRQMDEQGLRSGSIRDLLSKMSEGSRRDDERDDIADPFRRARTVHEQVATQVDALVAQVAARVHAA